MCGPVLHLTKPEDYARVLLQTILNPSQWYPRPKTAGWLQDSRLEWGGAMMPPMSKDPEKVEKAMAERNAHVEAMCGRLQKFLAEGED